MTSDGQNDLTDALREFDAEYAAKVARLVTELDRAIAGYEQSLDGIYRSAGRPYGPDLQARNQWFQDHGLPYAMSAVGDTQARPVRPGGR